MGAGILWHQIASIRSFCCRGNESQRQAIVLWRDNLGDLIRFVGHSPPIIVNSLGYRNDPTDHAEPIKPGPEKIDTIRRIFELYSRGDMTFESLAEKLKTEGHTYKPSEPNFGRRNLSFILNNRFYIGEVHWHGRVFKGKHRPLVDAVTFQACQDILTGKNRRTAKASVEMPLAGGLFRCKHCGQAITGEHIRRKRKGDGSFHGIATRFLQDPYENAAATYVTAWGGNERKESISRVVAYLSTYRTSDSMPAIVRARVEELCERGKLHFICCTSTLLQGVNLPAKNVIIENLALPGVCRRELESVLGLAP